MGISFIPQQDNSQKLQALLQMVRQNQATQRQQALDLIAKAQPGQTVEDLGLTPKAFKRVFGRNPNAGEVLKVPTAADIIGMRMAEMLKTAPPELVNTLAMSSMAREATGQAGVTTQKSFGTRAKTAETTAEAEGIQAATSKTNLQTINDLVEQAATEFKAMPAAKKSGLAQKLATGTTAAAEEEAQISSTLMTELKREALKFAAAPQTHALGKLFKSRLGMDPVAVMTSTVLGTNNLLSQMADLMIANVSGRSALETEFAKAAGKMSELTGFKINPAEVMAVWTESDPAKRAKLGPIAAIMETTADIMGRSTLTEAMMKGDPRALALQAVEATARQTKDPNIIEAVSGMYRKTMADLLTEQKFGARPAEAGPDQAAWDKTHQGYMNVLPNLKERGRFNPFVGGIEAGQTPGVRITPSPAPIVFGAPTPRAAQPPSGPTGTPAPKAGIQLPEGTTDQEIQLWQSIIDSIYTSPKKP